jgi:hypothetical protein
MQRFQWFLPPDLLLINNSEWPSAHQSVLLNFLSNPQRNGSDTHRTSVTGTVHSPSPKLCSSELIRTIITPTYFSFTNSEVILQRIPKITYVQHQSLMFALIQFLYLEEGI